MFSLRNFAFLLIALNFLFLFEGFFYGPEQWILKYDLSGNPISKTSRDSFLALHLIMLIGANGLIGILAATIGREPSLKDVNFPNKSYWTGAENIVEGHRRVTRLFYGILIFVNTIFLIILTMTRFAVVGSQANWIFVAIFVLVLCLIYWIHRLFQIRS